MHIVEASLLSLCYCLYSFGLTVTDINAAKILAAANQMVSLGLKDVGYQYVNIDVRFLKCTRFLS